MAWLTGWTYRQQVTLAHSTGAGTGYQVDVTRTMAQLSSHANADFSDVRFTASDGETLLSYYMVSVVSGTSFDALVKVTDDLSTVDATICMYYGKADASSASSAANTYDFYDTAATDGRANYTARAINNGNTLALGYGAGFYGAIAATNDMYFWEIAGLGGEVGTNQNYEIKYDCKFLGYTGYGDNQQAGIGSRYSTAGFYWQNRVSVPSITAHRYEVVKEATPPNSTNVVLASQDAMGYVVGGTIYTVTGRTYSNNFYIASTLDSTTLATTDASYATGTFGIVAFICKANSFSFKNVAVRHYVSPEPNTSAFAAEESTAISRPTLTAPVNAEPKILVNVPFTWSAVSGAVTYRLQVSTREDFATTVHDDATIVTNSATVTLSYETRYWWRVNATGVGEVPSAWSDVWMFETQRIPYNNSIVSGNNQKENARTQLTAFVGQITDSSGNPVVGVSVTFAIAYYPTGAKKQSLSVSSANTNASGQYSVTLTLGNLKGCYLVTATYQGVVAKFYAYSDTNNYSVITEPFQTAIQSTNSTKGVEELEIVDNDVYDAR